MKLEISSWAYLSCAIGILLLPVDILLAVFCAAAIHEVSHLVILNILHVPVHQITVGWGGARIQCGDMKPMEESLCAMAGPVGSLSLLIMRDLFPMLALFGLVQGLFNLIPIYPMDGGRMLSSILSSLFPGVKRRTALWIGWGLILIFIILITLWTSDI